MTEGKSVNEPRVIPDHLRAPAPVVPGPAHFPTPDEVRERRAAAIAHAAKEFAQQTAAALPGKLPQPDGSYRFSMDDEMAPDMYAAFGRIVGEQWSVATERPKLSYGEKQWWLILTPRQPEPGEAAP